MRPRRLVSLVVLSALLCAMPHDANGNSSPTGSSGRHPLLDAARCLSLVPEWARTYFVNRKSAVRGDASPRSSHSVLQERAYAAGAFQLN
jgi:hypothetical protein